MLANANVQCSVPVFRWMCLAFGVAALLPLPALAHEKPATPSSPPAIDVAKVPAASELTRICEALRAGREQMDNYRAVFTMHVELDHRLRYGVPIIFYRKGSLLRTDNAGGGKGNLAYVMRGSTWYMPERKKNPDGTYGNEIVAVTKRDFHTKAGETLPVDYSMRPEFICRAVMNLNDQRFEPSLDMNPTDGPAGCIRLSVRHTSQEGRINDKGTGLPDEQRFWLDPKRDYIAMRWDMVQRDTNGKEEIVESDTMEEVVKSPRGVWYVTQYRRHFPSRHSDKDCVDQVCCINVDFNVDLPDSLFDPPVPE